MGPFSTLLNCADLKGHSRYLTMYSVVEGLSLSHSASCQGNQRGLVTSGLLHCESSAINVVTTRKGKPRLLCTE